MLAIAVKYCYALVAELYRDLVRYFMMQLKLLLINIGLNFLLLNDTARQIRDLQAQVGDFGYLPTDSLQVKNITSNTSATTKSASKIRPILPAPPKIADLSELVTRFGAVPNDGIDDTVAIQKAIDTIANKGGGSVIFPPGIFDVSIQGQVQPRQAIKLRSGIRLAASKTTGATIKLADRQGNYESMMGTAAYGTPLNDFVLQGLTIDSNGQNNPVLVPEASNGNSSDFGDTKLFLPRAVLRAYAGKRIRIDRNRFTNQNAVWSVVVNGKPDEMTDVAITNSRFDNVGGNAIDFDHSSIYTSGSRMLVAKNIFVSRFGSGTKGARTAIEIHGDDQTIQGNTIKGFTGGINVTGAGTPTSQRQLYQDNLIEGVNTGFMLWHYIYQGGNPQQPALQNITIRRNTIKIDSDGWLAARLISNKSPSAGIVLEANSNAPIQDLTISDNQIDFVHTKPVDYWHDHLSSGILLWKYTNQDTPIDRVIIFGNRINNAPGAGIWSNSKLSGKIENNLIINPARSNRLSADNSGFSQVGIYLDSNSNNKNLYIQKNTIVDRLKPSQLKYGIVANSKCIGICAIQGNSVQSPAAKPIQASASWQSYNNYFKVVQ
jgi:Right handed beta helix region